MAWPVDASDMFILNVHFILVSRLEIILWTGPGTSLLSTPHFMAHDPLTHSFSFPFFNSFYFSVLFLNNKNILFIHKNTKKYFSHFLMFYLILFNFYFHIYLLLIFYFNYLFQVVHFNTHIFINFIFLT